MILEQVTDSDDTQIALVFELLGDLIIQISLQISDRGEFSLQLLELLKSGQQKNRIPKSMGLRSTRRSVLISDRNRFGCGPRRSHHYCYCYLLSQRPLQDDDPLGTTRLVVEVQQKTYFEESQ